MLSLTGRFFNLFVRLFVRRRYGDDAYKTAKLARCIFGAPRLWQKWSVRGLRVSPTGNDQPPGEWIEPANAQDAVIFYVHGGFISCSPQTHRPIAALLARQTNFRLFSVDYPLAPENRFPAALDDVFAAYGWLLAQNVSPARIAFAGDSAGGGLILSLLLRLRDENLPLPACAVCFSAWTDLAGTSDSNRSNAAGDDMFYPENIGEFAGAYLGGEESKENPLVSPVFGAYENFPPVLFHVGSTELLLDDSRRIHQKIQAAGGESHLEIYEDIFHCWQMAAELLPEALASLGKAAEFIRSHIS